MSYKVYVHKKDTSWQIFDDSENRWLNEHKQDTKGRGDIFFRDNWITYITNDWNVALSFIGEEQAYKRFSEILPALKDGQSVKRRDWGVKMLLEDGKFKFYDPRGKRCRGEMCLYDKDVLANDWEICEVKGEVKGIPTGNLTGMCGKCGGGMTFEETLPLNMELNAFKIYQITTNFEPDNGSEVLFDCKRSMDVRFEDLVEFFVDWEKLVKYAQQLIGNKIKASCNFNFKGEKTYQVFRMLFEGSNLKNSCHFMDWKVDNKSYEHQIPQIRFSCTILLSGGK